MDANGHKVARLLSRCVGQNFGSDFREGDGCCLTHVGTMVCETGKEGWYGRGSLRAEFSQGVRGYPDEDFSILVDSFLVHGEYAEVQSRNYEVRVEPKFAQRVKRKLSQPEIRVVNTLDENGNSRSGVGAKVMHISCCNDGARGHRGIRQDGHEGRHSVRAEVWEYEGRFVNKVVVSAIEQMREFWDSRGRGGAEYCERVGRLFGTQTPLVFEEPFSESCGGGHAVHYLTEPGRSPDLGQAVWLAETHPLQKQRQPIGSDVQDSFLRFSACFCCGPGIITDEPLAQRPTLVLWLFGTQDEKEHCYSKEQHRRDEHGPATRHVRRLA